MSRIITTHYIKQNNLLPILEFQFIDSKGVPIPIVGGTAKFIMGKDGNVKINRAAVIDDENLGKGHYTWQAGDTDIATTWDAEIVVTMPGNKPLTGPNHLYLKVVIEPTLA